MIKQKLQICLFLVLYTEVSYVELQNFTTTTTTTEAIDFLSLEPSILCKFQPNGYDCEGKQVFRPRFYYDVKMEDCKTTYMGSCPNNVNSFSTLLECHETCRDVGLHRVTGNLSMRIVCALQHDFGKCNGYYPKWYYDVTSRRCKGFSYSGCGGNRNRFSTQQTCATACTGPMGI